MNTYQEHWAVHNYIRTDAAKEFDAKRGEYVEQKEEKQAEVSDFR